MTTTARVHLDWLKRQPAGYPAVLGLTSADASYVPFFDSDVDGTIRDDDAGAVGYFYTGE